MSILEIDLTPEMEQRLYEKAKQSGIETKALAQTMMWQALQGEVSPKPKRSVMELEGLGAESWRDEQGNLIDAQSYVNALRIERGK